MGGKLFCMYDWGDTPGDWDAYGFQLWERMHTGPGQFSWGWFDTWLDKQAAMGRRAIFAICTHLSSMAGWNGGFYDATPAWVYDLYDSGRPVMNGRRVGHIVTANGVQHALPAYEDRTGPWWRELKAFTLAFGARYNDDPRVFAIHLSPGLDIEAQDTKPPVPGDSTNYRFQQLCEVYPLWYKEGFPTKPLFYAIAPSGAARMKLLNICAANGLGVKHNGALPDMDSHQGYDNFVGSWDFMRAANERGVPTWVESAYDYGKYGNEAGYWTMLAILHYHPVGVDLHSDWLAQMPAEQQQFLRDHVNVTAATSPSVWTVLREAEYPVVRWTQKGEPYACSGHVGDWQFHMAMSANSDAPRVMPFGPKGAIESRQCRMVKSGYFAIDAGFAPPPYMLSIRALAGPARGAMFVAFQLPGSDEETEQRVDLYEEVDVWKTFPVVIKARTFSVTHATGVYCHMIRAVATTVEPEPPEPPEPPAPVPDWAAMLALVEDAQLDIDAANEDRIDAEVALQMVEERLGRATATLGKLTAVLDAARKAKMPDKGVT